jgi:acyl-CoA thioesterase-2
MLLRCSSVRGLLARTRGAGFASASASASASAPPASALDAALALEELDRDLYLQRLDALWAPAGSRAVYGGQIIGSAMLAAERSRTAAAFPLHSLHAYFLRPGVTSGASARPILYYVTRLRDGGSFETRSVTARQNGEAIFTATLSFHKLEADRTGGAVGHSASPPDVPPPEACAPMRVGTGLFPVEVRLVAPAASGSGSGGAAAAAAFGPLWPGRAAAWFKCPALPPPSPATAHLHRAAIAFASDWGLGTTCLLPYGMRWGDPRITMAASLDHSLFFHDTLDGAAPAPAPPSAAAAAPAHAPRIVRHASAPRVPAAPAPPVRADDWLLVEFDSPAFRSSRGLNFSRMWTRSGTLILSAVQESLVRLAAPGT